MKVRQRTQGARKEDLSHLPGPAVLTNIFSIDHPADAGRVGRATTPVSWKNM